MNRHLTAFRSDAASEPTVRTPSPLDSLDASLSARHLVAYTPSDAELERLFGAANAEFGSTISLDAVRRIVSANPDTIHALAPRDRHNVASPKAEGFIAWLPLTAMGLRALLDGSFDGADPAQEHVAGQHASPAAIYFWAIFAPGEGRAAAGWAYQRWSTPAYRDADIYARGVTQAGRRFLHGIGFKLETGGLGDQENLFVFRRAPTEDRPLYDSFPSFTTKHTVTVVRNLDDLAKVMAVRSAAFLTEQACPFEEEFDGNDLSSTHLLGFIENEPAGCLRVRCFADFAKLERVSVLPRYRRSRMANTLIRAAHELCRMKGYTKVYGHAQKRLVDFWLRSGARPFPGARHFSFSDHDYVEMLAHIPSHPDAIAIGADPLVIIRPEGRWHMAGVLDRSANRPSTCPAGERRRATE